MSQALTTAEVSMINGIDRLNIISHNLANANTDGYKKDVAFSQIFDQSITAVNKSGDGSSGNAFPYDGYITAVQKALDMQAGELRQTDNRLDIAIKGNGFIEVVTPYGNRYTRAGSFSLDDSGKLVTSNGYEVSGVSGEIRMDTETPTIDKNGAVWNGDEYLGQIKIVQFSDTSALEKEGSGLFISRSPGMQASEYEDYEIYQGYVEVSNVNMMTEMVNLIETMRQIESSQKIISAYDEMMSTSLGTITEV